MSSKSDISCAEGSWICKPLPTLPLSLLYLLFTQLLLSNLSSRLSASQPFATISTLHDSELEYFWRICTSYMIYINIVWIVFCSRYNQGPWEREAPIGRILWFGCRARSYSMNCASTHCSREVYSMNPSHWDTLENKSWAVEKPCMSPD